MKRAAFALWVGNLSAAGSVGLAITGMSAGLDLVVGRRATAPSVDTDRFRSGTVIATAEIAWYRRKQRQNSPPLSSLAQGAAVTGVTALATAEGWTADVVAGLIKTRAPGFPLGWRNPIGHLVALAPAGRRRLGCRRYVSRRQRTAARRWSRRISDLPPRRVPRGPASRSAGTRWAGRVADS